jgi:hypothetical protein
MMKIIPGPRAPSLTVLLEDPHTRREGDDGKRYEANEYIEDDHVVPFRRWVSVVPCLRQDAVRNAPQTRAVNYVRGQVNCS